jgi:nucleotide-binding universal stress UspA family protein
MTPKQVCELGSFKEGIDQPVADYKRVAVAIDNSYKAAKVLRRALLMSKNCSIFYIIHVMQTMLPYAMKSTISMEPEYKEILQKESTELFEVAKKKAEKAKINYEIVLLEGNPADEMLKFIKENEIELIIVGSKDKIGSAKNLGSVSNKIASEATCSVLIER